MFRKDRHHRPNTHPAAGLFGAVDEVGIAVFFGALTADNLRVFTDELRRAPRPVRIDLAEVHRIDAAGLDALLALHDLECETTGVGVDLTAVSVPVARALAQRQSADHLRTEPWVVDETSDVHPRPDASESRHRPSA